MGPGQAQRAGPSGPSATKGSPAVKGPGAHDALQSSRAHGFPIKRWRGLIPRTRVHSLQPRAGHSVPRVDDAERSAAAAHEKEGNKAAGTKWTCSGAARAPRKSSPQRPAARRTHSVAVFPRSTESGGDTLPRHQNFTSYIIYPRGRHRDGGWAGAWDQGRARAGAGPGPGTRRHQGGSRAGGAGAAIVPPRQGKRGGIAEGWGQFNIYSIWAEGRELFGLVY